MKKTVLIGTLAMALASAGAAQSTAQPSGRTGGSTPVPNATVNPVPQSNLIHILTPVAGQAIASNIVQVRFEVTNPSVSAGSPNFVLQIDGADPITTTQTEYTFTGLAPGVHSVTVKLVDANGTPIAGGYAAIQFAVKGAAQAGTPRAHIMGLEQPRSSMPEELGGLQASVALPGGSSALPVLSVIGFGVLIGGAISAMKTRH